MNKTKRIIALILTVMMVNSTIGYKSIKRVNAHYYGPINISEGSIVVDASNQNVSPSLTAPGMLNVVIKGVSNTNNITFDGGLSRVTLSSLMIDTKTNYEDTKTWHPAIVLKNNAKVILTIENRVSLLGGGPNPAIHVPEGCELIIRSNSGDGNLFVRGGSNSAGIGANADFVGFDGNTEPTTVGKIHIESGTVRAEGKGAAAGIGGGYFGNTGQITISGGTVYAKGGGGNMPGDINSSLAGAGIGGGHSGVVEKINITGGNVIAVGGHKGNQSGAGIGAGSGWGYEGNYQSITEDSKRTCGQINITGGNISATGGNNNAVNAIGYGLSPTYDISGDLYAGRVTISDGVRVNTNGGAINPLTNAQNFNHYNLDMTIYDGRLTEAVEEATIKIDGKTFYGNLRVDENEKYKGLMDFSPLYHGTLSGEQALEISAGKYSWSTRVNFSESNMNYTASIGNKLYPVDLWFYDDAITSDLSGVTLSAQQGGRALNANPAQGIQDLVYDKRIRKQENGVGKMTVYMPAGLSDLTIEASGLNAGNPINLSDRTIKDSEAGTILVAWETDTTTEQFSGTLDISHGDIVFEDKGGKLDITYIAESGGGATTLTGQSYRNEYEVVQSSSGATSNRIIFINTMQFTNVNLNSVNMKVSGRDHEAGRAIDLFKAKAKLTLNGENIIDCGNTERNKSGKEMGIRAGAGSELTIDGSGSLEIINPSYYGVGIGGYYVSYTFGDTITEAAGIIRIEGGSLRVRERLGTDPMKGSCYGAAIFEGWAADEEEAKKMLSSGEIEFLPCHSVDAVGPMGGITSGNMAVLVVENKDGGNRAYCTMNEGIGQVLRFGAYNDEVVTRLHWMKDVLGPVLSQALQLIEGGMNLNVLVAQAITMGDEFHQRNIAASALFMKEIMPSILKLDISQEDLESVTKFLADTDQFFLNIAMAFSKAVMDSARTIEEGTVVTALTRNGYEFGIRVSGMGDQWFTAPVNTPEGLFFTGYSQDDANPDIGDSAITEAFGVGGMAMIAAPGVTRFVGAGGLDAAQSISDEMKEICIDHNPNFSIPTWDFKGACLGIDIRKVVETGITPVINTGIAHKKAGVGQVGAGTVRAPLACFTKALEALVEKYTNAAKDN